MVADKIRIKKYQQSKVEQWCKALDIPESRFVEDAINLYVRHLEGKSPIITTVLRNEASLPITPDTPDTPVIEDEENFDGGIEL